MQYQTLILRAFMTPGGRDVEQLLMQMEGRLDTRLGLNNITEFRRR
jgi:hypothetical protein